MKKLILALMIAATGLAQTLFQAVLPLMVLVSFGLAQTPFPTPDISAMVAKIKAAKTANKPFVIYLNDGSTVTVANAGCLAQNPSGNLRRYVF